VPLLSHTVNNDLRGKRFPFTLQYVAGHDNIKTTMCYVHPREDAVEKLFVQLGNLPRPETRVECKKSVQNPVQSDLPSYGDLAKLLNAWHLQRAEVVELADTPSNKKPSPNHAKLLKRKPIVRPLNQLH